MRDAADAAETPFAASESQPRRLNDLAAALALAAMWKGRDPAYVAESMLDVLGSMLRLDGAQAHLPELSPDHPALEAEWPSSGARRRGLAPALLEPVASEAGPVPSVTVVEVDADPAVGERWRVARVSHPVLVAPWWIAAASQRPDFPTHEERFLLRAVVEQAAIAIEGTILLARERAAIRTRDDFLAAAAHDLKTPLAAMKGYAQLLQRLAARADPALPDQVLQGLAQIDASATKMTRQVDELLDVAQLRAGETLTLRRRPTDLVALTRRAVAAHQESARHHDLRLEVGLAELKGQWDEARVERVVDNLIGNAVKYSAARSPLGTRQGVVLVSVHRDGESAVLTVRDNGIGIPAGDLPHIFERFRRGANVGSSIGGSGIGLASARQIVEQHGGTIAAESGEPGTDGVVGGSTFTVRLPLEPERV